TVAGTYTWHVSYVGDGNNNGTDDTVTGTSDEVTKVSKASPRLVTTAGATVTLGSGDKLTDTADLEGGYFPTGSITFTLHDPSNPGVSPATVGVSGKGTYQPENTGPPAGGNIPTVAGTYHWSATYNPDSNNLTAIDDGTSAAEAETVIAPSLVILK